jgi:lipoprotein-releasing system permease protein
VIGGFELFVAGRYLRAKRKQAVISVITVISILGVAAGVMALVVALAITNGFRNTLQGNLLGATAHVSILEKEPGIGISGYRGLVQKLLKVPHVTSATPTLYGTVLFSGPLQSTGGVLKGVDAKSTDVIGHLKQGSVDGLTSRASGLRGIILGSGLAAETGMMMDSVVHIISPQGVLTPYGPRLKQHDFRVVGIFETGFFDLDSKWAYVSLASAQSVLSVDDVVNSIELKVDNVDMAPEVGKAAEGALGNPALLATNWQEQNRRIMNALKTEKIVTVVTIGLIQLVAAMNILIALIMMVMEKYRDIAVMMSMGARHQQIRKIFMIQGVLIGMVGTVIGLITGYSICYFADKYRWIRLDEEIYSLSYLPFDPRWPDAIWIAAVAIAVSFLATLYPARNATKILPVEALRYE